ncbi:MAG: NfeD family protein [Oscillospiraceae bacterium]|nr:NfeD family protein [Oscillospiraceae bacterium]
MKNFYLLIIVISGLYLFAQTVAFVFFGKIFFPDAGELFENNKEKSLMQTVFPKNMLRLIIVIFAGALAGVLMDAAGLDGVISLPLAAVAGITVNFVISTVFSPIYLKFRKSGEPSDEELSGLSAVVVEEIDDESFGIISVKHGTKSYLMRAITANGRFIPKGKKVIVIYAQDGCCFVESEEHFCDILFEEE